MFYGANAFNQPLGSWNTSAVTTMKRMFRKAKAFNHPVGSWDTSSVTTMETMFWRAYAFNQPLDSWNTSAVTTMKGTLGGGAGDRAGIDLVTNSPPQQATYPAPLLNTQW